MIWRVVWGEGMYVYYLLYKGKEERETEGAGKGVMAWGREGNNRDGWYSL